MKACGDSQSPWSDTVSQELQLTMGADLSRNICTGDYEPVHQLFPLGASRKPDEKRVLDIFFFHGLQKGHGNHAYVKTWTNGAGQCWPRDWLPEELRPFLKGPVRVVAVYYNAQATERWTGIFGRSSQGHNSISRDLFHSLVTTESCSLGSKPFVLVGHSYGGIVIKSLVCYCHQMLVTQSHQILSSQRELNPQVRSAADFSAIFMANLRGTVFYGVPQQGTNLARIAKNFIPYRTGKSLDDLQSFNSEISSLTRKFETAIQERGFQREGVAQLAFGEANKTGKFMVVERASAQGNLDDAAFMELEGTDHTTVCKPNSKEGQAFRMFVDFLKREIISKDPTICKPIKDIIYKDPLICKPTRNARPEVIAQVENSTRVHKLKKYLHNFFSCGVPAKEEERQPLVEPVDNEEGFRSRPYPHDHCTCTCCKKREKTKRHTRKRR